MIIVTGGTGLLGGHLIWFLLQKHERVCAIKRSTSSLKGIRKIFSFYTGDTETYFQRIDWKDADIQDEGELSKIISQGDCVYHCAAVVNLSSSSNEILETNIQGTKKIVKVCLQNKVAKFCYVSSIAACSGDGSLGMIDESVSWIDSSKKSAYSRSKYFSEQEVWTGISHGLNAVIVNPGVILGPYGSVSGSAELFERVRSGMPVYTTGGTGYVDVRDVVKPMIALMESEICSERFILVSENLNTKFIFDHISAGFGKRPPFIKLDLPVLKLMGLLVEMVFKVIPGNPPFSRSLAESACKRESYSSAKIKNALQYEFIPISQSIKEICGFLTNQL